MSVGQSRAFLFGLTLTELMILFVFLLALLVGAAAKKQRELETVSSAIPGLEEELAIAHDVADHAQEKVDKARSQMQAEQRIRIDLEARLDNLSREIDSIREDTGSAHELMAVLNERDKASFQEFLTNAKDTLAKNTPAEKLIRALQESLAEPVSRRELKAEMDSLRETLKQEALARESAELTVLAATDKAATLEQEGEVHRRRAEHYRNKLANGRGVDLPPCWLNESGSTEYLFSIKMTSSGYQLDPGWADHRREEAMRIPGVRTLSGNFISSQDFLSKTRSILGWANEHECRHFVRVSDEVGANKNRYKRQLQRLEQHFYKYLLN